MVNYKMAPEPEMRDGTSRDLLSILSGAKQRKVVKRSAKASPTNIVLGSLGVFSALLSPFALPVIKPPSPVQEVLTAECTFESLGIRGTLYIKQDGNLASFTGNISGLTPGNHGFHVHEVGSIADGCSDTGPHFDPTNAVYHGAQKDAKRHTGDLGNVYANNSGIAYIEKKDGLALLSGRDSIIGRSIVIHQDFDYADLSFGCDGEYEYFDYFDGECYYYNYEYYYYGDYDFYYDKTGEKTEKLKVSYQMKVEDQAKNKILKEKKENNRNLETASNRKLKNDDKKQEIKNKGQPLNIKSNMQKKNRDEQHEGKNRGQKLQKKTVRKPGNSGNKPGNSSKKPGNSGKKPGNSGKKTGSSGNKPGNSGKKPGNQRYHTAGYSGGPKVGCCVIKKT